MFSDEKSDAHRGLAKCTVEMGIALLFHVSVLRALHQRSVSSVGKEATREMTRRERAGSGFKGRYTSGGEGGSNEDVDFLPGALPAKSYNYSFIKLLIHPSGQQLLSQS